MCRLIYLIWEFCQMFSIAQQYNGRFTVGPNYQKGRAHLLVTDFRVTGKGKIFLTLFYYENY